MSSPATAAEDAPLIRTTAFGAVKGKVWDRDTLAWLGIPYAKPPVAELRWKAPRDPDPWDGVLPTEKFRDECVQYGGILLDMDPETFGQPMGTEDCLYLNIWRPVSAEENLPVLVYLHGGLNGVGEAATSLYHGAHLACGVNAVVVTINYRLGIFGWFAHEALRIGQPLDDSGNYGLLDIIKALEWVQRCATAFGGNPDNVTVFGESAGAFNIGSLLASPLSDGLFHRALAISPLVSLMSTSMHRARERADNQLARLLVNTGLAATPRRAKALAAAKGSAWTADFLRGRDAVSLLRATRALSSFGVNGLGLTIDILGGSRFADGTVLPLDFKGTYQRGEYHRVPVVVGSTRDEMRIFEIGLGIFTKLDEAELCKFIQTFDPDRPVVGLTDVLPRYLKPAYALVGTVLGNTLFEKTGVDPSANLLSRHVDVFVFKFCWDEQPAPFDTLIGASHMMPLPFLFGNFQTDRESLFRFAWSEANLARREELSREMMAYVGNFARSGDPNCGPTSGLLGWPRWSPSRRSAKRLVLDVPLSVVPA
jgi:para-nitrobenzyl esterase